MNKGKCMFLNIPIPYRPSGELIVFLKIKTTWQFFMTFLGWLSDPLNGLLVTSK